MNGIPSAVTLGLSCAQAKEFGEAEVWMNERLMRSAPNGFAQFVTAFEEAEPGKAGPLWLVWRYEGDFTLADLMKVRADWCQIILEDISWWNGGVRHNMRVHNDHCESVRAQMATE